MARRRAVYASIENGTSAIKYPPFLVKADMHEVNIPMGYPSSD